MIIVIFVLSKFKTTILAANHFIIPGPSKFDNVLKSSIFLLKIMTPI